MNNQLVLPYSSPHRTQPPTCLSRTQVIVTVIGMARLGGLVRFISSPVLAGFTNAAALVMAMSQLPNLLGFHMPGPSRSTEFNPTLPRPACKPH